MLNLRGRLVKAALPSPLLVDHVLELVDQATGVDQLTGVQAGHRGASDVAHIVHARLHRGQPGGMEPLKNIGNIFQTNAPQLDILVGW